MTNICSRRGSATALPLLVAFCSLATTAGTTAPSMPGPGKPGDVNAARVLADTPTGYQWLLNGRDFGSSHFSPLDQIDQASISRIGLAWAADIDSAMGMATEPLVVDGVIYVSGTLSRVFAIDARSGKLLWRFDPQINLATMTLGSYTARVNRGVAVWEGKVFVGTGDCRVFALDAASGKELWQTVVCDARQTGITQAPRVGGGKVYVGYFGSDSGTRGSLVALDANTGKIAWRFWNVPGDPAKGFESKALAMAAKTWKGANWWQAGGGASWDPIVYDEASGLVIYGTADPGEGLDWAIKTSGDRLFTNCIIAVDAASGEYVWHYQTSRLAPKGHSGAYGAAQNFHIVVADALIKGAKRRVAMTVPSWGGFVMLDAKTGELISWKSMSDRPPDQRSPATAQGEPRSKTGRNWWPMSYSPVTGLAYVPIFDLPVRANDWSDGAMGRLMAWDPIEQTPRWSISQPLAINGGVLSTAGNLVFQGEGTGEFSAYAADNGRKLWSIDTGSAVQGVPVSYQLDGKQYVLVPVGLGGGTRLFSGTSAMATPESKRGPSRLLAFSLDGTTPFPYPDNIVPPVPQPPKQTADRATIARGERVLEKYMCWGCHGGMHLDGAGAWIRDGAVPDLRYMPEYAHQQFLAIVMGGLRRQYGMPGFADGQQNWPVSDQMSLPEAQALYAYIVDVQWKAYNEEQAQARKSTGAQH